MIFPTIPSLVCSIEGDDKTGAGGTGEGDGKPSFDAEKFKEEMKDFTIRAVNGAVSTHLSRAMENKLQENNTAMLSQFKEMLQGATPEAPTPPAPSGDLAVAIKNATAPLQKQLEEQRAMNERNAATAKNERETRLRQEENSALQTALTGAGVPSPLASAAVNLLHGSIERGDDGAIKFVAKETGPTGAYDERVDVAEGVARFLKTDDGKHFLPARPVGGSGNQGGNPPGTTPTGQQQSDGEFVGDMLGHLFG